MDLRVLRLQNRTRQSPHCTFECVFLSHSTRLVSLSRLLLFCEIERDKERPCLFKILLVRSKSKESARFFLSYAHFLFSCWICPRVNRRNRRWKGRYFDPSGLQICRLQTVRRVSVETICSLPAQFPPVQTLHFNIRVKAALHCKLLSVFRRREPRPLFFLCMLINGIIVSSQLSDPDRFSPLVSCSRNPGTTLRWRPSRRRGPTPTRPATATTSSRPRMTSYSASPRWVHPNL